VSASSGVGRPFTVEKRDSRFFAYTVIPDKHARLLGSGWLGPGRHIPKVDTDDDPAW
jgi:hypothetical protein